MSENNAPSMSSRNDKSKSATRPTNLSPSKSKRKQNKVVDELVKSLEATDDVQLGDEEGYGTDDDDFGDGLDGYTSPLNDAPSYHSYLTLVPEYEDEEQEGIDK